jgi:uncharacterized surface protein with fasciclin (FAS1) repeats
MNNKIGTGLIALTVAAVAVAGSQQMMMDNPMVGGAAMMAKSDIVTNAMNSPVHKTLVAAVKAAGLVETLQSKGPFTVFAPTDNAFKALPDGTVGMLVMPENKAMLTKILTYHVVAGKFTSDDIIKAIKKGNGTATLTTVSGGKLYAMFNGPKNVVLKDEKGGMASISTYDVMQSNGVIHVIDSVLMPN